MIICSDKGPFLLCEFLPSETTVGEKREGMGAIFLTERPRLSSTAEKLGLILVSLWSNSQAFRTSRQEDTLRGVFVKVKHLQRWKSRGILQTFWDLFVWYGWMPACTYVYHMYTWYWQRPEKNTKSPDLKLQMIVSHRVDFRNRTLVPSKNSKCP